MSDERLDMPAPQGPNGRGDLLVDRAAAALRQAPVPDGPPADLLDRTLRALGAIEAPIVPAANESEPSVLPPRPILHPNSKRSAVPMKTLLRYAAAAVIAVVAGGLVLWMALQYGSRPALADVLRQVRDVKAVSFKVTTRMNMPGNNPAPEVSSDVLVTEAGLMRQTVSRPVEAVTVIDLRAGKALTLIPSQKQAMVLELANLDPSQLPPNALDDLKKLDVKDAVPVGEKEINGRMFNGFRAVKDGQEMTFWVDPGTRLPVRMELKVNAPMAPAAVEATMTDFVWNAQVDPSQLTLTPPPDYKVQTVRMNMGATTEKDLTEALRTAAELDGGAFPDNIDMAGLMDVMKRMGERLKGADEAQRKAAQAHGPQAMLTIGRGWMFIGDAKNGEDFRYAGQGAKLGEKGRAVMWYKPKGSETYRVIDADLTVHEGVKADDLPKLPSKPVSGINPSAPTAK